ncbi:nose resistant to fluoxetine protein 6-like [Anopheles ziemanni]|uniref:nose resistant to fluoxetine protein 6-like n=1 Tax=Anopheles coustani TaxID=139045 RepID=UPI002658FF37|nr:nose resistant to fluoxetine protein 6-like [Anopheles coustani]XP_058176153.1 nose resistant to fluoxetine protein 6-like [Anopheles ziemanni]
MTYGSLWLATFAGIPAEILQSANTSLLSDGTHCEHQFRALVMGLKAKEFWSIELVDSWGKWPAGIFAGNLYELGHYDQCVDLWHNAGGLAGAIQGRYCFLTVPLKGLLPASVHQPRIMPGTSGDLWAARLGACIPAACTADHFLQLLNRTVPNLPDVRLSCNQIPEPLGGSQAAAIAFFATILLLALASTLYDVVARCRRRKAHPNLVMFSLVTNGRKLLATVDRSRPDAGKSSTIDCINGIRVISMVWVVFSHNYTRIGMVPLINSKVIGTWLKSYHSVLVVASTVSVDSFFVISGVLTCWSLLNALDKSGRLNLPLMYVHRYLRLTPALGALVLYSATLMRHNGSGPFWDSAMTLTSGHCRSYWWSTLLYVQNYVNPRELCLGHTWYLSVDMQLYLLAPLLIYPLWRWGRRALLLVVALALASMVTVLVLFLVYDLRLSFLAVDDNRIRHVHTYYPTHTRAGAWLVGVGVGYVLQRTRKHYVPLARWAVALGWTLAAATMLTILFADHPLQQPDYATNPLVADALYEALNRVAWAGAVGWIVFACVNGYGGPVNRFLGATIWQPLGRLSYSIYLLHLPIQLMMAGSARLPYYFTDLHAVYQFWGDIGFTLTLALAWALLFESPIIGLERMLFGRGKNTTESRTKEEESNPTPDKQDVLPKTLSLTLQTARL